MMKILICCFIMVIAFGCTTENDPVKLPLYKPKTPDYYVAKISILGISTGMNIIQVAEIANREGWKKTPESKETLYDYAVNNNKNLTITFNIASFDDYNPLVIFFCDGKVNHIDHSFTIHDSEYHQFIAEKKALLLGFPNVTQTPESIHYRQELTINNNISGISFQVYKNTPSQTDWIANEMVFDNNYCSS